MVSCRFSLKPIQWKQHLSPACLLVPFSGAPQRISRSFCVASAIWLSLWARAQSDQNPGVGSRNSFTVATRWYCLMLRHQAESIPMNIMAVVWIICLFGMTWEVFLEVDSTFMCDMWSEEKVPRHATVESRATEVLRPIEYVMTFWHLKKSHDKPWQAIDFDYILHCYIMLHHINYIILIYIYIY